MLDDNNYRVDFSNNLESVYTFEEGSSLISSYSNAPNYLNIKNDFHIWGISDKNENSYIHYHLAIKQKPQAPYPSYSVVYDKDSGGEYTGTLHIANTGIGEVAESDSYVPADWRAALYMSGLYKKFLGPRPDIYEQEILDFFDSIYDMRKQEYKADIVNHPNDLKYWIDYICPMDLFDISVDTIGSRVYSYQKDGIKRLYNTDVPDFILINNGNDFTTQASIIGDFYGTKESKKESN